MIEREWGSDTATGTTTANTAPVVSHANANANAKLHVVVGAAGQKSDGGREARALSV